MSIERLSKFIKQQGNKINLALGEFLLTKKIGQGGNGLVYEASFLGNIVAIKFLITDTTGKTKQQKLNRFLAEYFNIITMDDPAGIVRYIDYDQLIIQDKLGDLEIPVIIMKRYDGSLSRAQDFFNVDEFYNLFNFLLDTTEKIHNARIIHRDIKPENILVGSGSFVLADFGIASYNPEIFQVKAETVKNERIGNRLFSAPEQEEKSSVSHPTMDIYAIGQVLQWYATGKTHRGTGRQRISKLHGDLEVIDSIIEKCLENDPSKRFQTVNEIRECLKSNWDNNPFEFLSLFGDICRKNFPKNPNRIIHSNDIDRIDCLLNDFKQNTNKFKNTIWWHAGLSHMHLNLEQIEVGCWKFGNKEFKINEIWIHYDNDEFNDFILVHHLSDVPFIVEDNPVFFTAIVDDVHHISYSEYQSGYAEINGNVVNLSNHKVEFIERQNEEGFFFICNKYHCLFQKPNDSLVDDFLSMLKVDLIVNTEELKNFINQIRKNIDVKVFKHM